MPLKHGIPLARCPQKPEAAAAEVYDYSSRSTECSRSRDAAIGDAATAAAKMQQQQQRCSSTDIAAAAAAQMQQEQRVRLRRGRIGSGDDTLKQWKNSCQPK